MKLEGPYEVEYAGASDVHLQAHLRWYDPVTVRRLLKDPVRRIVPSARMSFGRFFFAAHPSGLVCGTGCLYVRPKGTVLLLR